MTSTLYKCTITIHAPLHIGCDAVYEPMGFVLDEKAHLLTRFDPAQFIASLAPKDRETLSALCQRGDLPAIMQIYKFFRGRTAQGKQVKVSPEFTAHYQKTLSTSDTNIQNDLNKFIIERTAFKASDGRPFIPGSSVKGALRTGVLNHLCGGRSISKDSKKLEKILLKFNRIDEDPFSHVKISDFQPAGDVATRIVYAINKKKKPSQREARGPYQILEVIEPGAVFTGEITVRQPHPSHRIKQAITLEALLSGTHAFYQSEYSREKDDLRAGGLPQFSFNMEQGDTMIRMGRHCGAESVTLKGNRSIKIMMGKGQAPYFAPYSTTLWLAAASPTPKGTAGLSPFGWATLSPMPPALEKQLDQQENAYLGALKQIERERKQQALEAQRLAQDAQRREAEKQAALEQEKRAQEARQKELEAMSPEDRELTEIFDIQPVIENEVVDLFNRLDQFEAPQKQKAAQKIKAFYQACGKWKVNKKKKKQYEKVQKLKSILGEV